MRGKWWLALLALIVFPTIGVLLTNVTPKRYTAQMRLMVDTTVKGYDVAQSPFAAVDDVFSFTRPRSTSTHVAIITGSDVLAEAVRKAAVQHPDVFGGDISGQYESMVRRLAVDSEPLSDVIGIRITMDNPQVAADAANSIGQAYIEYLNRMSNTSGSQSLALVNEQLGRLKSQLTEVDDSIEKIKNEYNIADANVAAQAELSALLAYENKLVELRAARDGAYAELRTQQASLSATPKTIQSSSTTAINPMVQQLDMDLIREEANLKGIKERYADDHPDVLVQETRVAELRARRQKLKQEIEAQRNTSVSGNYQQLLLQVENAKARHAALTQQVQIAERAYEESKRRNEVLPSLERKLIALGRRRQVLESSMLQLDQRREILEASGSGRRSVAQIVSTALPPTQPSFPDQRLFFLIGLAIGVIVAALIIMPRGDQDLYGQWNQRQAKALRAKAADPVQPAEPRPAIEPGDDDPTVAS